MGGSDQFIAINAGELEWKDDTELLTLPEGVQIKMLSYDPATGRRDFLTRFPPSYVEPRHTHGGYHSDVIMEGEMHVAGKVLRRGDYLFGPGNVPHGPMSYPVGCTVFASFYGDTAHVDRTGSS